MDIAALVEKAASLEGLSDEERRTLRELGCGRPGAETEEQLNELKKAIESAEQERDRARGELQDHLRRGRIAELAERNGFGDRDYLDYLLSRQGIDPADAEAVPDFMGQLRETSPKLFTLDLRPGSGNPPGQNAGSIKATPAAFDLAAMLAEAPEVTR